MLLSIRIWVRGQEFPAPLYHQVELASASNLQLSHTTYLACYNRYTGSMVRQQHFQCALTLHG